MIQALGGPYGGGQDDFETGLYACFGKPGQTFEFIRDRSFHYSTKMDLKKILGQRKIDLLFIDGDRSYAGVKSDFQMYQEFVADDGLIVFHDINLYPETWGRGFDVGVVWSELKQLYPTKEIIDPHAIRNWLGFTFDRHLCYGFGLLKKADMV